MCATLPDHQVVYSSCTFSLLACLNLLHSSCRENTAVGLQNAREIKHTESGPKAHCFRARFCVLSHDIKCSQAAQNLTPAARYPLSGQLRPPATREMPSRARLSL